MRSLIKITFILLLSLSFDEVNSLSNNKILQMCKNEINKQACIKKLKTRRSDLNEGKPIEIEVIPYKE